MNQDLHPTLRFLLTASVVSVAVVLVMSGLSLVGLVRIAGMGD